jgi:excisionase family DNA binding protein
MAGTNVTKLKSLPQAAEHLGLSVKCLRTWIWKRKIPYVKVGRAVRISEDTIRQIVERGSVPALKEGWDE